jgi:3-dehydroquinate synthase
MLTVNLGENSYDILIGGGTLSSLGRECAERGLSGRVAVISNPSVADLYAGQVQASLSEAGNQVTLILIPDGEEHKNAATLNRVYDELIEAGLDRNSFIVALGGGVVGDLAGFAAATFLRGIPFVQVPTTLLAQVDSSVGGKTAIDHPRGKNLIGAFHQPRLVLIDVETLGTLPRREFLAGLAEVVKYGAAMDQTFFQFLEQNSGNILVMDRGCLGRIILSCCELKARVVEQDEKESGLRAILNYGHTLGHAIETLAGYGTLVHGEAVAIGMALAARVSLAMGYCGEGERSRIVALLERFDLPHTPPRIDHSRLAETLLTDKKNRSGIIRFICNRGIGDHVVANLTVEQLLSLSGLEV